MGDIVDVPLLSILFERPADGLPLYHLWVAVAKDIWHRGYENWREVLEVKGVDFNPGSPMLFRSVIPVKGLGRISVILWGILWAYLHKDDMDCETISDFLRPGPEGFPWIQFSTKRTQNTNLGNTRKSPK